MVFCNSLWRTQDVKRRVVTILILIDGFLQYVQLMYEILHYNCHNPFFNTWFSANYDEILELAYDMVTILILIDGFLQ